MVLHRKKLFDGRATAQEVHSKLAFPHDAKCTGCKTRAVITRILVLCPIDEMKKKDPLFDELMMVDPVKFNSILVQTKHGPHVKLSTVYACSRCTPAAERVAAKAPSWMIIDINRGPTPDRAVSGAGGLS